MLSSLLTYVQILAVSASISLSGAVSIPTPNDHVVIEITIGNSQSNETDGISTYKLDAPARVEAVEDLWGR